MALSLSSAPPPPPPPVLQEPWTARPCHGLPALTSQPRDLSVTWRCVPSRARCAGGSAAHGWGQHHIEGGSLSEGKDQDLQVEEPVLCPCWPHTRPVGAQKEQLGAARPGLAP